jgi:hypothetical protein
VISIDNPVESVVIPDVVGLGEYRNNLAVTRCLKEAGFVVLEPPLEEFVEELGWNWAHADIWGAAYRDNDRDALEAFVDTLDQVCPDPADGRENNDRDAPEDQVA